MTLIVTALGGNALLKRGEPPDIAVQRRNVAAASAAVAALARDHGVVVTHGNGPQVGLLALQAEAYRGARPYPLDVIDAESEGLIGYLLQQDIGNRLPGREVVTVLTQVEVDPADPAFAHPTKPIGPIYARAEAESVAAARGWTMVADGSGFRRAVASPEPRRIVELPTLRRLVTAGVLPICVGGGGIPVARQPDGTLVGVEAVIDKDLAAARLAIDLAADMLLLLTDVPAVYADWTAGRRRPLGRVSPRDLLGMIFEAGTMGPKVTAACRFAAATGRPAGIGRLDDAAAIVDGRAGTTIA